MEIDLLLSMFSRPPDLYKGTTRAFFHSSGTDPVLSDKFTRNVTVGARENDGTEREAPSPGLGICQIH